jgi:hypothetical protein
MYGKTILSIVAYQFHCYNREVLYMPFVKSWQLKEEIQQRIKIKTVQKNICRITGIIPQMSQ